MAPRRHDDIYTGRYEHGWLNLLFGKGNYTLINYSHSEAGDKYNEIVRHIEDPDLSFAYVGDTKTVLLWLHDYPGWLSFCEPMGIEFEVSPKFPKRVTPLTKLSAYHLMKAHDEINIVGVKPDEFSVEEHFDEETAQMFLDGANVICRDLVDEMVEASIAAYEENFFDYIQDKDVARRHPDLDRVREAMNDATSAQIRVVYTEGQIKGDTLIVDRSQMPQGVDIMYCVANRKHEFKSHNYVLIHLEPYPSAKVVENEIVSKDVWSDMQTMSWMGDWLFQQDDLEDALVDYCEIALEEIRNNKFPKFFTDTSKLADVETTVERFRSQFLNWEMNGLGIRNSIFLQQRVGQGIISRIFSKRKWPLRCTMYVHVATDSWLHMAGFYNPETGEHPWPFPEARTERGYVWYHEATNRLIYNDLDFAQAYRRHGGWDLDDSVRVHARTYQGEKVFINVRSPNSMGEYDIKKYVEGTYAPTWMTKDGDVIEFPEVIGPRPPFIEELDITYRYPDGIGHKQLGIQSHIGTQYTPEMIKDSLKMALKMRTTFGGRANADMVYFHTMKDYRREQLTSIENIIDACVQEPSDQARLLIEKDREDVIQEIELAGMPVDRMLWEDRSMGYFMPGIEYVDGTYTDSVAMIHGYVELYQGQFNILAQRAKANIPDCVLQLGKLRANFGRSIVSMFRRFGLQERDPSKSTTQFYGEINNRICQDFLDNLEEHVRADIMFSIAYDVYTREHGTDYQDNILFQVSHDGHSSLFDYYLDAIEFYGIKEENWSKIVECLVCGNTITYTDRVAYQRFLGMSRSCRSCEVVS